MEADLATQEKRACPPACTCMHPLYRRRAGGVGRQLRADGLRRGRGDGRAGARRARLRVRDASTGCRSACVIRSASGAYATRSAPWQPRLRRARRHRWIPASSTGSTSSAAVDAIAAALEKQAASAASACSSGCATGASRASATGAARSRSSTARPAATCRCRTSSCRCVLPEDLRARRQRQSAGASAPSFLDCTCPKLRQAGAARDRHHGHLRGFVLVFPALRLRRQRRRPWSTSG